MDQVVINDMKSLSTSQDAELEPIVQKLLF